MAERQWFTGNFELTVNHKELPSHELSREEKLKAHELMLKAKCWERFLSVKFPTLKRYSGEGSEAAMAFHWCLMEQAGNYGIREVVDLPSYLVAQID